MGIGKKFLGAHLSLRNAPTVTNMVDTGSVIWYTDSQNTYCVLYIDKQPEYAEHTRRNIGLHTCTHEYSTPSTWAGDLRTHFLGIGRQCMCVSVLDAERERDTSPSGLYVNHVYYIRHRKRERERERERERHDTLRISSVLPLPIRPSLSRFLLLPFLTLMHTFIYLRH